MTKGRKHKRKKSGGYQPAAPSVDQVLTDLEGQVTLIEEADEVEGATWGAVHKLLLKAPCDTRDAASIIAGRDVQALRALLKGMQDPAKAEEAEDTVETPASAPDHGFSRDDLKHAMRAFKKRLKLTRLDQESKLGRGPFSGGKASDIDAIMPPRELPEAIWEALVSEGELRRRGTGFYELTSE